MHKIVSVVAVLGLVLTTLPRAEALSCADASEPQTTQSHRLSQATGRPPAAPLETSTGDGTPATVVDGQAVYGLLGKNVRSSVGEDMGRVVDILINKAGIVRAAVIDFGGFLGVGNRKIAVDWSALRFPGSGKLDRITLELTRDQVRLAPEYRPGEPIVVLGASGAGAPIEVPTPNALETPPPQSEK